MQTLLNFDQAFERLIGHEGYAIVGCCRDLPERIS